MFALREKSRGGQMQQIKIAHFQEEHENEMLDIVDSNDEVVHSMPRALVYQKNLYAQIRSIWLIIKNDKGQLWIPRRSWNLKQLPGHLDGSVSGHVQAGETYEQALIREATEEIGCDLSGMTYQLLGKLTPQEHKTFCFSTVYECVMPQAPECWNRDEICEWKWMRPEEIIQKYEQGEKIKSSLPIIIKHFYLSKK